MSENDGVARSDAPRPQYPQKEVYLALSHARKHFQAVVANQENPHFKSQYADLSAVLEAVTEALNANDLLLIQTVRGDCVRSDLVHIPSGGIIESWVKIPDTDNPQKMGSAITYARRYAAVSLLGLTTEKDDDGNAASVAPTPKNRADWVTGTSREQQPPVPKGWLSYEDCAQKHAELAERVVQLPETSKESARSFRAQHGWPLDAKKFAELEEVVRVAEALG